MRFFEPLEKEFRQAFQRSNVNKVRLAVYLATVLILAYSLFDWYIVPTELSRLTIPIRLVGIGGLLAVTLIVSYTAGAQKTLRYFVVATALGAAAVCIGLDVYATANDINVMFTAVLLVVIFVYFFVGLLWYAALRTAIIILVAYVAAAILFKIPIGDFLYNALALAAANVIGAMGAYVLEHTIRTNFLESKLLNQLVERDGLTGLYNRRMFDVHIDRVWRQARRESKLLSILLVDIDYFKRYNDLYGHQAGDDCLRKVANILSISARRPYDIVARYGGEEFIIVLYDPPRDYIKKLPEQLRMKVAGHNITHVGSQIADHLTISIGVAIAIPSQGRSHAGLIQLADEALYAAKEGGRNRVVAKETEYSMVVTGAFRAEPQIRKT